MKTDTQRFKRSVVSRAAITALWGTAAMLATQETLAQQTSLERVEITGSAIRRVDAETALPVTVLRAEELRQQGYTTVEEIIHTLSVNQSLTGTAQAVGTGSGGASYANIRGLGANKTLVLLNGRRIANNAVDSSAPDLNMIPIAAIDRIEVLRDGASSLYGTDAIGGVINFITKKDFSGAQLSAQYNHPQHAGGKSYNLNVGAGRGDLDKDRWNVFGFIDYQKQEVLSTPQRSWAVSADKTSPTGFPGSYSQAATPGNASVNPLAPACSGQFQAPASATNCAYYYWNWVDLVPASERLSGMLKGTMALAGDHQLGVEWFGTKSTISTNIAPVPYGALTVNPGTPYYPGNGITPPPPAGVGFNPTLPIRVRWRSVPAGPRQDRSVNFQQRFLAQLEGNVAGWDYNTGLSYNSSRITSDLTGGYTDGAIITPAVRNGLLNPFTTNLTSANGLDVVNQAQVRGRLWEAEGKVTAVDGRVSRELGDWFGAGRKAGLALGAEYRREQYAQDANTPFAAAVIASTGFDPDTHNRGARNIWAVYGEVVLPVIKSLEVTASVRHDNYSDFGSTTNPKLSFRFQPSSTWLARGSLATGFRAPSLYDLYAAQVFTNTANDWNDPVRCPGGTPIPGASQADNCGVQFMSLLGGNPKLTPEKSKTATLGFVLQPSPQFDLGVDFWWIKLKNQIAPLSDVSVFTNPTFYASKFRRAADGSLASDGSLCGPISNPGPTCGYVELLQDNQGGVNTNGVDITATYRMRTSGMGNFTFRVNETYVHKYEYQREANGAWIQNVGRYEDSGPVFRNQLNAMLNWNMGQWSVGLATHYKSGYRDQDVGQAVVRDVGAWQTWDLYGTWAATKNVSLTLGVKNLFDKQPPATEQSSTFQVGYDPRFADPFQRVFYARGTMRF